MFVEAVFKMMLNGHEQSLIDTKYSYNNFESIKVNDVDYYVVPTYNA